jgi:hypothetical protein
MGRIKKNWGENLLQVNYKENKTAEAQSTQRKKIVFLIIIIQNFALKNTGFTFISEVKFYELLALTKVKKHKHV